MSFHLGESLVNDQTQGIYHTSSVESHSTTANRKSEAESFREMNDGNAFWSLIKNNIETRYRNQIKAWVWKTHIGWVGERLVIG